MARRWRGQPNVRYSSRYDGASMSEAMQSQSFDDLGVPGPMTRALALEGKVTAFPIQQDTLPDSLAGRDILGRGRTGSGKTLAFAIPMVARLASHGSGTRAAVEEFEREKNRIQRERASGRKPSRRMPHPRGLILAPTRELANQIDEVLAPLARAMRLTTVTVYGGVKQGRQVAGLNAGADIVVACPGRLEDLLRQNLLSLESVEVAVLDEADEMADMGFLPAVERLLAQISDRAQCLLFSATLDHGVDKLVKRFLHDPKIHSVDEATSPVALMTHHVFLTTRDGRFPLVCALAKGQGKRILFTRTKFQAEKLARRLRSHDIPATDLHGNLSQRQRDRNLALFTDGGVNVLVATDVAARGIDVSGVALVVHVDPPNDPKSFLHRSGRTARAGHAGDVVTLVMPDQRRGALRVLREAGIHVKPVSVREDSPEVGELVERVEREAEVWRRESEEALHAAEERAAEERAAEAKRQMRLDRHDDDTPAGMATGKASRRKERQPSGKAPNANGRNKRNKRNKRRKKTSNAPRFVEDSSLAVNARGGRRVHRKPIRVVEDLRGEDAKRHDRQVAARAEFRRSPDRHKRGRRDYRNGR